MKERLARLTNNYSGKVESEYLNAPHRTDSDNIQGAAVKQAMPLK
jgi:hypothetical protein